ncbi:MAG: rRNA maturation RNase YbeY [Lachnospiraceae bacterium]|jgi:probable rRNA maturation factor|nr:rRNA maturation RNase YbeY [Lachnospiraceae bacterium]
MIIDWMEELGEESLTFDYKDIANRVIEATCDYVKCHYEISVEIGLVDNENICIINNEYRNIDKPTDVLSFPMNDIVPPADFSNEANFSFDPDTGELILGDIIISKEKVKSQAEEFGHSEIREYAFLITHSMLHLFGYDHIDEDERKNMESIQKKILQNLNILR